MTINQIHTAIKIGLDKTSNLTLPSFEPEEIDFWFNKAQEKFVDSVYEDYKERGTDSKLYDYLAPLIVTFPNMLEATKPINKDSLVAISNTNSIRKILQLTRNIPNPSGDPEDPDGPFIPFEFSRDIRYIFSVYAYQSTKILEDGTVEDRTYMWRCKEIKEEDSIKYMRTAVNIPYFEEPVYYITQDYNFDTVTTEGSAPWDNRTYKEIVVLWDSFTTEVSSLYISVLRNPIEVSLSSSINCELPTSAHQKIVDLAVFMMIENIESQRLQTNALTLSK